MGSRRAEIVISFSVNLAIASPLGHMSTDGALRFYILSYACSTISLLRPPQPAAAALFKCRRRKPLIRAVPILLRRK
jgi:hypothetical protein